jgi:putative oxidoreductase
MLTFSEKTQGAVALGGRILLATMFILSGIGKLAAPGGTQGYIAAAGLPFPPLAYLIAVIVELGGGSLLLLGYRTRLMGVVLAVFALATALLFHHDLANQGQSIHFFKNLAIAGGLLQIVAFGPGLFSLDGRRQPVAAGQPGRLGA